MRPTISLGRWAGVPVGANISVLVIVLLVGLGLALGRFPFLHPDRPVWQYLTAGAVAALLLVLSILLHELSHAVVARSNGIEVEQITLWLLGGVAQLKGEARSPRVDFAVAVVGPLMSVALGAVFAAATLGWLAVAGDGLIAATLSYLALINLILAAFNLVPAAPLDGGRVLRSVVWWRSGDQVRAAVVAARAGRYFGIGLIVLGIGSVLLLGWFGGLWFALIGWFLVNAAMAEERQVVLNRQLHGIRVRDVMSGPAVTAPADVTVVEFIDEVVLRQRFSTYPLVGPEGQLSGLTTLNRIRDVPAGQRGATRLREIACPPQEVPTARPDEPLVDLLPRLAGCTDGRAVVLDAQDRVVAVVSPSDISRVAAQAELRTPA